MLILYIPFKPNENNDILARAKSWLNDMKLGAKAIIIQHGEEIHLDYLDVDTKIYVLGHGIDSSKFPALANHIASTPYETTAIILSIEEVAKRFEQDFFFYQLSISVIKLYFCSYKNDAEIAKRFKKNINFQDVRIEYYFGSVTVASFGGHKHAFFDHGIVVRASQSRYFLKHNSIQSMSPDENEYKSVRDITIQGFAPSKQRRTNLFFERNKVAKYNFYVQSRNKCKMEVCSVEPG